SQSWQLALRFPIRARIPESGAPQGIYLGPGESGRFARIAPFASRFMETRDDSVSRVRLARDICDLGPIRDLPFRLGPAQHWRIAVRGRRLHRGNFRGTHRANCEVARRKTNTLYRPIF